MTAPRLLRRLLLPLALIFSPAAWAVDSIGLKLGRVQGAGWQAAAAQLQLDLAGGSGELRVTDLVLPAPVGRVRELRIRCPRIDLDDQAIACGQALFHLRSPWLTSPDFRGSFNFRQSDGLLRFAVQDLRLAGGHTDIKGEYTVAGWQLTIEGRALQLAELRKNAGGTWTLPADLTADGNASLRLSLELGNNRPASLQGNLDFHALNLAANDGTLASDTLALALKGKTVRTAGGWSFEAAVQAPSGQVYVEPVFLDFAKAPLVATARGQWQGDAHRLTLDELHMDQADTLQADAALSVLFAGTRHIQSLKLHIGRAQFPGAYLRYLQPFMIGTSFDSLETAGRVSGDIELADNTPQRVELKLDQLQLDDSKRRFALYGASGLINWSSDPAAGTTSELKWEGGSGYKIRLGAAGLKLRTAGPDIVLQEPARLPVLDGGLQIRRLEIAGLRQASTRMVFDGQLEPISMEGLCRALGWPVFSGTLAGTLPTLEYQDGNLTVGGTLRADVFDGRVEVDKLRMEQPFGLLPKLSADMKLRNIDLHAATSAFSFGRIEGRLDGDVKDLRLLKWKPVAFDGRLYTTPGDRSRHRISQRAIENISNLGGSGAAGALSRGFLRFFEDFGYDRLALGCRLENNVCHMSGVGAAPGKQAGGYYIVKGSLIPRIDVIGFASQVNWDAFVSQLKGITESGGPVIQ